MNINLACKAYFSKRNKIICCFNWSPTRTCLTASCPLLLCLFTNPWVPEELWVLTHGSQTAGSEKTTRALEESLTCSFLNCKVSVVLPKGQCPSGIILGNWIGDIQLVLVFDFYFPFSETYVSLKNAAFFSILKIRLDQHKAFWSYILANPCSSVSFSFHENQRLSCEEHHVSLVFQLTSSRSGISGPGFLWTQEYLWTPEGSSGCIFKKHFSFLFLSRGLQ